MKNTLITLTSVAALAVSANAQVLITPADLGFVSGDTVNGTFDVATLTGIEGLNVTITGGTVAANSGNWIVGAEEPTTFSFDQAVDVAFGHGSTIGAGSLDGVRSNGAITFVGAFAADHLLVEGSVFSQVENPTASGTNGADGNSLRWEIAGATVVQGFTTGTAVNNAINISVSANSVPEPSSTALLGLGALGLLARRKR